MGSQRTYQPANTPAAADICQHVVDFLNSIIEDNKKENEGIARLIKKRQRPEMAKEAYIDVPVSSRTIMGSCLCLRCGHTWLVTYINSPQLQPSTCASCGSASWHIEKKYQTGRPRKIPHAIP